MKLFQLVLWQLIVVVVVGKHHVFHNTSKIKSSNESRYKREIRITPLTLNVRTNGEHKVCNLVPTNQLLANKHLPVWISSPSTKHGFRKLSNIMSEEVGSFTMYHDYATTSAIVYFHKRRELDGIIDMMYKIEGLPVVKLDEEITIDTGVLRSLNIWKYFVQSPPERLVTTCLDKDGKSSPEIPLPMDGTPCNTDSDMVCWEQKCIPVGNYAELGDS